MLSLDLLCKLNVIEIVNFNIIFKGRDRNFQKERFFYHVASKEKEKKAKRASAWTIPNQTQRFFGSSKTSHTQTQTSCGKLIIFLGI